MTNLTHDKASELRLEAKAAQAKARREIEEAMSKDGQFTHNIIGLILRGLSAKFGTAWANELVVELEECDPKS